MNAPDILSAAAQHMQDRAATYDKPEGERSMGATVEAFNAVTGHSLTEEQGWLFMALLKAVRSQQGAFRPDSYEDGAAYFALAGETAHKERAPASFAPINTIDFRRTEQWPNESRRTELPDEGYTGQGGVMVRCPDCNPEKCPCIVS